MLIVIVTPHPTSTRDSGDRVRTEVLVGHLRRQTGVDVLILTPRFPSFRHRGSVSIGRESGRLEFPVGPRSASLALVWKFSIMAMRIVLPFSLFGKSYRKSVRAVLNELQPDCVDFQHTFTFASNHLPSICTVHNVESYSSARRLNVLQKLALRRKEKKVLRSADCTVVLSDLEKRRVVALTRNLGPTRIVPLGLDPQFSSEIRKACATAAFVGSFDYEPNRRAVEYLYGWWSSEERPASITRLLIIGRQANTLPNPPISIELQSDVPNVGQALIPADLLLVPLDSGGGVRVKIIEALSMGLPVVCTALAAEGLGLANGKDAFIAHSLDDFGAAVLHATASYDHRLAVAKEGLATWRRHFSGEKMAASMLDIYQELVSQRSRDSD